MSYRLFVFKQSLTLLLAASLGLQGILIPQAHADQVDDFIAKTDRLAEGIAGNTLNMMLLGALQQAVFMSGSDPAQALEAMKSQTAVLRGLAAKMNRSYSVASDSSVSLSGERLAQLYRDYVDILSQVTSQKLKIDGIRRDGHALKAVMMTLAEKFLQNLDERCREGYSVNPYDKIRPSLEALMPAYEFRLSFEVGDGQGIHVDPSTSVLSLGKTSEEQAMWALFYAGNVIVSTYALTGAWALSADAFGKLALGTQMSALGMALGVTAAVAAIIVAVQISQARDAAKKASSQQRRVFEQRADQNTVNRYFTDKCRAAQTSLAGVRESLEKLGAGDATAIQELEVLRSEMKAKIQKLATSLQAYVGARQRILGADFDSKSKEDQVRLLEQFDNSEESKAFLEVTQQLKPEEMTKMLAFIFKDIYRSETEHAGEIESAFQQTINVIDSGKAEQRAAFLKTMSGQKSLEEIQLRSAIDLKAELKQSVELAEIYSALDRVVVDLAELVFAGGTELKPKVFEIEQRVVRIDSRIQSALIRYPDSELLKVLKNKISQAYSNINRAGAL